MAGRLENLDSSNIKRGINNIKLYSDEKRGGLNESQFLI